MTSAVEQPPPIRPLRSSTVVLTPDAASTIAAESPFGPEPIIVAVDIPPLSIIGPKNEHTYDLEYQLSTEAP
jgi:hypothetical protein